MKLLPKLSVWLLPTTVALVTCFLFACPSTEPSNGFDGTCNVDDDEWSLESAFPAAERIDSCANSATEIYPAATKLAVAVYHFNIQYVAGGLRGIPYGDLPKYDLGEIETEDRIVTVGLEPVLDLFLAHPTFKADIELQGYMVEVIAERHPAVLEKMQTLARRGQIDFDSFHYSDQLYVAYPRRDQEVSIDLTKRVFDRACLPLGRSIFTQEGQFARGQISLADDEGYRLSIIPRNLFRTQMGEPAYEAARLFVDDESPNHLVIVGGKGFSVDTDEGPLELSWTFMNDGEIAFAENSLNPYFGTDYVLDEDSIEAHIDEMEALAAQGFVFTTIAEAVDTLLERGVVPSALPPIIDGTWQPDDTNNVYRWMGGKGLWRTHEADGEVLADIWRTRQALMTIDDAGSILPQESIDAAWRHLLLAQVSDATGWNPFYNEIDYAFTHAEIARGVVARLSECSGIAASVTPFVCADGDERTLDDLGMELLPTPRPYDVDAHQCGSSNVTKVTFTSTATVNIEPDLDNTEEEAEERHFEVAFDTTTNRFELTPGLRDELHVLDYQDYAFETYGVPLSRGLISLGDDKWVVQEHITGRTAVLFDRTEGNTTTIVFSDRTIPRAQDIERAFYVLEDTSQGDALVFALKVNR